MGAVTFSIDTNLIDILLKTLPINIFVETGTFNGDTLEKVKNKFKQIYSIELSPTYYEKAQVRFKKDPHISLIQGDSGASIKVIMPKLKDQSVIYWFDAHWCVDENTAGETSQCPLLHEITAVEHLNQNSVIIIDDARLFLATPPAPHEISDWPSFTDILQQLFKLSNQHKIMILNDCILYFPESVSSSINQYAFSNGIDWLHVLDKSRDYDKLLQQLIEKEAEIQLLAKACREREAIINSIKS